MTHLLLAASILVMSVYSFTFCYCHNGVTHAYLGLYKGLVEKSVIEVDTAGEYLSRPVFYLPLLRDLYRDYLEVNLMPYCKGYSYSTKSGDGLMSLFNVNYANSVVMSFRATLLSGQEMSKTATFAIGRGNL